MPVPMSDLEQEPCGGRGWIGQVGRRHRHAIEKRRIHGPRIAMESMQGLLRTVLPVKGLSGEPSEAFQTQGIG